MLPITDMLLTPNEFSRPRQAITVRGIVMHWTANEGVGANAAANRNFFENRKYGKTDYGSAHYIVDDHSIVRCVPDAEMAYHCGSKTYTEEAIQKFGSYPNNCTIGIEICVNQDGSFTKTYQNTVELVAYLCKKYNVNPKTMIFTHKKVVGWKDCPAFFSIPAYSKKYMGMSDPEAAFNKFVQDVINVMHPPATQEVDRMFKDTNGHWATSYIDKLAKAGIVKGDSNGNFRPDEAITRAEVATLVARALEYLGK